MIDRQFRSISRKLSVAPMMDWTDNRQTARRIRVLRPPRNVCLLYGSSHTVQQTLVHCVAATSAATRAALSAPGSGGPGFCSAGFGGNSCRSWVTGGARTPTSTTAATEVDAALTSLDTVFVGDRTKTSVTAKASAAAKHKSTRVRNLDECGSCESRISGCEVSALASTTRISVADPVHLSQPLP